LSSIPSVIQLIHTIIAEYGTGDLDLLQHKLKQMRILDNIELPDSVLELLVKQEESSSVDSIKEVKVSDAETESTDEEQSEQ
jgi:starch phosphorylase